MWHQLEVIGNLARDAELRKTPDGKTVCVFNVASNRKFKTQGGEQKEDVVWFRVSIWHENLAKNCADRLHKGDRVFVSGRLTADENGDPRVWQKKDGTWHAMHEMSANDVRFLSDKHEAPADVKQFAEADDGL